ncbi:hypothetical protein, partial [Neisseria sicca]|uniref:hypothetical protein n=1 Tax=Neisseria sicca TaxID=490 RepID=UPI001649FC7C
EWVGFEVEEWEGGKLLEVGKLVFEIGVEGDSEEGLVDWVMEGERGDEMLDDIGAEKVVVIELVGGDDGEVSGMEGGIVGVDVGLVLGVGGGDFGDGRYG